MASVGSIADREGKSLWCLKTESFTMCWWFLVEEQKSF